MSYIVLMVLHMAEHVFQGPSRYKQKLRKYSNSRISLLEVMNVAIFL